MKSVVFKGQRVAYSTVGLGAPVVFVHGSFASSSAWRRLIACLDASLCNVIALDLPGWGESDPSPADCVDLVEYEAAAVAAVVADASVGPIHLVGHSHGGTVALAVALGGHVALQSLTLFEPLPVSVLSDMGDTAAYGDLVRFVSDYRDAFDAGDPWAVRGSLISGVARVRSKQCHLPHAMRLLREQLKTFGNGKATSPSVLRLTPCSR